VRECRQAEAPPQRHAKAARKRAGCECRQSRAFGAGLFSHGLALALGPSGLGPEIRDHAGPVRSLFLRARAAAGPACPEAASTARRTRGLLARGAVHIELVAQLFSPDLRHGGASRRCIFRTAGGGSAMVNPQMGDVRGGVQPDPDGRGPFLVREKRTPRVVFIVDKNGQLIAAEWRRRQHRHHFARIAHCRQHCRDWRYRQALCARTSSQLSSTRGEKANHPHPVGWQPR